MAINRSVGTWFEETVARQPGNVAVKTDKGELSYTQLNARANRIAASVQPVGQSQQHVGLLFDPDVDAISTMLGVLLAGHVYVPLDPADPQPRIRFVLQDSQARAILTTSRHAELATRVAPDDCPVVTVDTLSGETRDVGRDPGVDLDAPAYLLYTSGSTGQPKGVIQTHRNLLHFVSSYCTHLGIGGDDRLSLLYSLTFSASNMDIYGALLNGATLFPYDPRRRGTADLGDWLAEQKITILHTVPTLFRRLLEHLGPTSTLDAIRAVDLGGEPVYGSDVTLHRRHFRPGCILINHFAATEASVIAQYTAGVDDGSSSGIMPAGRAAPGIEIRIVGKDGSDVAPDATGDIVIHSAYLSPGYWRRPQLTASTFAQDPSRDGWRTFRTGDVGSLSLDGQLTVHGRQDTRVKVRGHSVELSEVEAALRAVVTVEDAAVVAVTDNRKTDTSARLAAYVVTASDDGAALRRTLSERLPSYMLPSEFNIVDNLPRMPTGKVDRRALSAPDRPRQAPVGRHDPPRDAVEHWVKVVYERVLGISCAGRRDDFFALGGDSLSIVQLQIELSRVLGTEASPSDLLEDATVAGVAHSVRTRHAGAHTQRPGRLILVPLRVSGPPPALFLVHGALGQAFVSPTFLTALGDEQPLYAIQARGLDRQDPPHDRVADMARDYIEAMREVQPAGPYLLGGICAGGMVAHEMACQLQAAGQSVGPLLLIDPPQPPSRRGWSKRLRAYCVLQLTRLPVKPRVIRARVERTMAVLRRQADSGRTLFREGSVDQQDAAVRVALSFQLALRRHTLGTFVGPAHVIASRKRLSEGAWRSETWRRCIVGPIDLAAAGSTHRDVLDPKNQAFAVQLKRWREAARHHVT